MGVDPAIDITAEQRKIILTLLNRHLPGTAAWVYGSRATWASRPQSDLDLVVFATPEQVRRVGDLRQAFEESDLPFRVDLLVWSDIPESFREQIERNHVVLSTEYKGVAKRAQHPLRDLADVQLSSVDKKVMPGERSVRLCNYTDVYYNNFIHSNIAFMEATASEREIEKCTLKFGDVVITKDSEKHDDIGVPALVREEIDNLVCGYHLAILRPQEHAYGPYLYYALSTRDAQQQFHSYANGITRFGLRKADVGLVELPTPALHEQRAIAHVLGTLDDKIELNRRMNETLEAMARALFKSWFVDFDPVRAKMEGRDPGLPQPLADLFPDRLVDSELGKIPDGWGAASLSDLIDLNPKRTLRKGQVAPYLDMASMPTKGHVPDKWFDRPFGSGMRFTNGDTLLARITPCLENGKTAYVDFLPSDNIGWGSTEYIVMRPKPPIPNEFAYCLARSPNFREFAIHNMTGTSGRQRVPAKALAHYPLVAPEREVADVFGKLAQPLFTQASVNARKSHSLASQRDALLPKLISGDMRVTSNEGRLEALT